MKRENINSGHMQELCTHVRLNNKKKMELNGIRGRKTVEEISRPF